MAEYNVHSYHIPSQHLNMEPLYTYQAAALTANTTCINATWQADRVLACFTTLNLPSRDLHGPGWAQNLNNLNLPDCK